MTDGEATTSQDRTGHSIRKILRDLCPLHLATIEINAPLRTYPPAIHDHQCDPEALTKPPARLKADWPSGRTGVTLSA